MEMFLTYDFCANSNENIFGKMNLKSMIRLKKNVFLGEGAVGGSICLFYLVFIENVLIEM